MAFEGFGGGVRPVTGVGGFKKERTGDSIRLVCILVAAGKLEVATGGETGSSMCSLNWVTSEFEGLIGDSGVRDIVVGFFICSCGCFDGRYAGAGIEEFCDVGIPGLNPNRVDLVVYGCCIILGLCIIVGPF